jgi:hypothetical protein
MQIEAILSDDALKRESALKAATTAPEHERSALAAKVAVAARDAAAAVEANTAGGEEKLARACVALSILRVEGAKSTLLRVADEGIPAVKLALVRALRQTTTVEGRAVLVHLLADDDARDEVIRTIGVSPWPEVLPALIEVAEADDHAARLAATPIAKCGVTAGPKEANAAADFLLELLDDEVTMPPAVDALLRFGNGFLGIPEKARRLAKEPGKRKIGALCLVAAYGDEGNAAFLELALSGIQTDLPAARLFLDPMRKDADERVRTAAERTWKALDLGPTT